MISQFECHNFNIIVTCCRCHWTGCGMTLDLGSSSQSLISMGSKFVDLSLQHSTLCVPLLFIFLFLFQGAPDFDCQKDHLLSMGKYKACHLQQQTALLAHMNTGIEFPEFKPGVSLKQKTKKTVLLFCTLFCETLYST